jgi:hypothetical protein
MFSNLLLHEWQPLYMLLLVYQLIDRKVFITNHQIEDNLEIHLEEIHRESHPSIHLLDLLDGQHLIHICLYHRYQPLIVQHVSKPTTKLPYMKF